MARVAVVGPGAIGGVLAAIAAEHGHDVTICARTPFATLTVRRPGREGAVDEVVAARIVTDPGRVDPADWVLLATKAHHTAGAEAWLRALTDATSTVLVAQNGIDHTERVSGLVDPRATVVPSTVVVGAEALAPGHVVHHGYGAITVPAGPHVAALTALLGGDDGLEVVGTDDFGTAAWRKLLSNAIANPVTALTGRRNDVLADPAVAGLIDGLGREVIAVARAAGADLGPADLDELRAHYAAMSPELGTSMLYDRLAGRPLEHEHLTGAVVAAGARHGVPTPVNDAVLALLRVVGGGPDR